MAPRARTELSRNRKIRAMMHVLRGRIHAEKFEMRTMELMKSCMSVLDGRTECTHTTRKCMCTMFRLLGD